MLTLPLLGPSCLLISHFPPVFDCARASTSLIHGCVMPTFIWWPLCVSDFDLVDAWLSVFVSQPPVDGSPPLQIKHIHRDWQFRWYDLRCQHQRLKFFFRGEPQLRWRRWWRLVLRRQGRTELVTPCQSARTLFIRGWKSENLTGSSWGGGWAQLLNVTKVLKDDKKY